MTLPLSIVYEINDIVKAMLLNVSLKLYTNNKSFTKTQSWKKIKAILFGPNITFFRVQKI